MAKSMCTESLDAVSKTFSWSTLIMGHLRSSFSDRNKTTTISLLRHLVCHAKPERKPQVGEPHQPILQTSLPKPPHAKEGRALLLASNTNQERPNHSLRRFKYRKLRSTAMVSIWLLMIVLESRPQHAPVLHLSTKDQTLLVQGWRRNQRTLTWIHRTPARIWYLINPTSMAAASRSIREILVQRLLAQAVYLRNTSGWDHSRR